MSKFQLEDRKQPTITETGTKTDSRIIDIFAESSTDLNQLDSTMQTYTLDSSGNNLYEIFGYKDPNLITAEEEKSINKSILNGIDEKTFNKINVITGQFLHLQTTGLFGSLGGVLDLVIGVLDLVGLTDDLLTGVTGLVGGGALGAGVTAVLGSIFGADKVAGAIKEGATRSSKFSIDTSKRITRIQTKAIEFTEKADGHKIDRVHGNAFIGAGSYKIHSESIFNVDSPLTSFSSDTMILNSRSFEHIVDFSNINAQQWNLTVDDSINVGGNIIGINGSEGIRLSADNQSIMSKTTQVIGATNLHLQGGANGLESLVTDAIGDALGIDSNLQSLSLSSTGKILSYSQGNISSFASSYNSIDGGFVFINCFVSADAAILAVPRPYTPGSSSGNPPTTDVAEPKDSLFINNGSEVPSGGLGTNSSTNLVPFTDSFNIKT
jgi:hypothetical protein